MLYTVFQFFREHCGEADNTECSSAGAVNAYMPRCVHLLCYVAHDLPLG